MKGPNETPNILITTKANFVRLAMLISKIFTPITADIPKTTSKHTNMPDVFVYF